MSTKIGINVIAKTARQQNQLVELRDSRAYYEDAYNGSIRPHAKKIIEKITDVGFDIESETSYLKNGEVMNAIIFVFYNESGIDKKTIRKELKKYIDAKFTRLFNCT